MNSFSENRPVRIGRTTNRKLGFITPSSSDDKCPYFHERFIRHGDAVKENRAICGKTDTGVICDYRIEKDGIPFCQRYWYGPLYEVMEKLQIPYVQKRDPQGNYLFYKEDGVTITTSPTTHRVMESILDARPIQYVLDNQEQLESAGGSLLYWDHNYEPPALVQNDTGFPAWNESLPMEFFSTQYEDTHEKVFGMYGNRLGWHLNE